MLRESSGVQRNQRWGIAAYPFFSQDAGALSLRYWGKGSIVAPIHQVVECALSQSGQHSMMFSASPARLVSL
jgi:hypothetical protein